MVGNFLKTGYFFGYWLLSHWKCTGNMGNQNPLWSTKYWKWSENVQWPTVISSTAYTNSSQPIVVTVHVHHKWWLLITGKYFKEGQSQQPKADIITYITKLLIKITLSDHKWYNVDVRTLNRNKSNLNWLSTAFCFVKTALL